MKEGKTPPECQEAFKKAYDDYPSQDNEGYSPDCAGFKCGFHAAWDLRQKEIDRLSGDLSLAIETLEKISHPTATLKKLEKIRDGRVLEIIWAREALEKIKSNDQ